MTVQADGTSPGPAIHPVSPGRPTAIGRERELGIGVDPLDVKVSRQALVVTASTGAGWKIEVTNHNRADLQLWGQPWLPCRDVETVSWPLIAVRVKGADHLLHLVLLEDPALMITPPRVPRAGRLTESVGPPQPLTALQREALCVLFADLLAWPPRIPAEPLLLKQAATKLNIKREALQRRLEEARTKALALGLGRTVPLTDPEYLYVLVRAGYLAPCDCLS